VDLVHDHYKREYRDGVPKTLEYQVNKYSGEYEIQIGYHSYEPDCGYFMDYKIAEVYCIIPKGAQFVYDQGMYVSSEIIIQKYKLTFGQKLKLFIFKYC
jgi:hypothetical protein